MKKLIVPIGIVAAVAAFCFFLYGCYWAAKNVSYNLFYEDMVKATIVEMVKKKSLKEF